MPQVTSFGMGVQIRALVGTRVYVIGADPQAGLGPDGYDISKWKDFEVVVLRPGDDL